MRIDRNARKRFATASACSRRSDPPTIIVLPPIAAALLGLIGCDTKDVYFDTQVVDSVGGAQQTPEPLEPIIRIVPPPAAGGSAPSRGGQGGEAVGGGAGGDGPGPDAGNGSPPNVGGSSPAPDAGLEPIHAGAPIPNTPRDRLELDLFGTHGNKFFFYVNEEQLTRMNEGQYYGGDIYVPRDDGGNETFVEHLLATPAGDEQTADLGKLQVRLIGGSTYRQWTEHTIPNLKVDADEFIKKNRIGGQEHVRFNNAIYGGIFKEKMIFDLYRRLGYPAPRVAFGWVSSNVWNDGVKIPYLVVESYKPQFCEAREEELGGGCLNMWEGWGDLDYFDFGSPEICQFSECDATRAYEFQDVLVSTPRAPGFKAALADYVEWDAFHQFQCLAWIIDYQDGPLNAGNNLVIAERADGKFQYFPYSVDLSMNGQGWLPASSHTIAGGCQQDPDCWADLISTCEGLLEDLGAANPIGMIDDIYADLEEEGMLRNGDSGRYQQIVSYFEERLESLPADLELNRDGPNEPIYCDYYYGEVDCGGWCGLPEECNPCEEEPVGDSGTPACSDGKVDAYPLE